MQWQGWGGTEHTLEEMRPWVDRGFATLTMSIAAVLREQQPDAVVTHAYEGSHPDHDAIAFAVQTACALLEMDGWKAPVRLEAAGYADLGGDVMVGEFVTPSFTDGLKVEFEFFLGPKGDKASNLTAA